MFTLRQNVKLVKYRQPSSNSGCYGGAADPQGRDGPETKIRMGSRMRLMILATHKTFMEIAASLNS